MQSPVTLLPGTYWLAFLPENPDLEFKYEWIPGQYTGRFDDQPYGEMPFVYDPHPIGVEYHFSLYATLMEGDLTVFPNTGILDDFNRADGSIGSNWSGETSEFSIASNALNSNSDISMIGWNGESFGADQEAFVTLTNVDTGEGNEHGLILKSQSAGATHDGAIEVAYDGANEGVLIWTYTPGQGWILVGRRYSRHLRGWGCAGRAGVPQWLGGDLQKRLVDGQAGPERMAVFRQAAGTLACCSTMPGMRWWTISAAGRLQAAKP